MKNEVIDSIQIVIWILFYDDKSNKYKGTKKSEKITLLTSSNLFSRFELYHPLNQCKLLTTETFLI